MINVGVISRDDEEGLGNESEGFGKGDEVGLFGDLGFEFGGGDDFFFQVASEFIDEGVCSLFDGSELGGFFSRFGHVKLEFDAGGPWDEVVVGFHSFCLRKLVVDLTHLADVLGSGSE